MKQLFLDSNEAFEIYIMAMRAVGYFKKDLEEDYKLNLEKSIIAEDERRLKVAKKLLDFARASSKAYLITEIENPF